MTKPENGSRLPVAILGFDAAELTLVQQGIDEGWLPTMASLLKKGQSVLLSPAPSHFYQTAWPATVTGTDVGDHQVLLDRQLQPGTYRIVDETPAAFRRQPFWRYISDQGLRSTIVGIYAAPMLESFRGVQVLGWGTADPFWAKLGKTAFDPPEGREWLEHLGRPPNRYRVHAVRSEAECRRYKELALRSVDAQARALEILSDKSEWDFLFASFDQVHHGGHLLWYLEDPSHPRHDPAADRDVGEALRTIYGAIDSAFAQLLERLPSGCRVFVLTPHGMGQTLSPDPSELILERGGWLVRRRSPAQWRGHRRERVLRATWTTARRLVPTRLRLALREVLPRDRLTAGMALADVDWSSTRAFALPSDITSCIRINLAGREPDGIVQPGREYEQVCEELRDSIEELVLADSGLPAVERVIRCDELLGRPVEGPLPDLCVVWIDTGYLGRLHSPALGLLDVPFDDPRSGHHRRMGFMVGTGPGIAASGSARLDGPVANVLDVAPTALAMLGVDAPAGLAGTPIASFAEALPTSS